MDSLCAPSEQGRFFYYSPADFDAARCLPFKLRRYEEEARYFIGLIHWHQVTRFGHLTRRARNHGVELKAAYLREVMGCRAYKRVVAALEASDAVRCDHVYLKRRKCYTYTLGSLFKRRFHRYEFKKPKIIKALAALRKREDAELTDLHRWLKDNLARIEIDAVQARLAAAAVDHPEQAHISIDALETKTNWYRPCKFGRVHTNVTNLKRDLRKFLTVDGNRLVLSQANPERFTWVRG